MKKLLLIIVLCLCSISAFSQDSFLSKSLKNEKLNYSEKQEISKFQENLKFVNFNNDASMLRLFVEINQKTNLDERKQIFKVLNDYDKIEIWKVHFAYCLTKFNLPQEQIDIVKLLVDSMTKDIYSNKNTTYIENEIKPRIEKVFDVDTAVKLFLILGEFDNLEKNKEVSLIDRPQCNCAWSWACKNSCLTDLPNGCTQNQGCGIIFSGTCTGMCMLA